MSQAPMELLPREVTTESRNDPAQAVTGSSYPDSLLVKIAREIAIDHYSLDDILKRHSVSVDGWEQIQRNKRFQSLLQAEIADWQSATNTHERTKLKAAAVMEIWLEEANKRLFDARETLSAKTEVAKLVARIAGMGLTGVGVEGGAGEKVSITINLGADQLKVEHTLPPKVIEGEVIGGSNDP